METTRWFGLTNLNASSCSTTGKTVVVLGKSRSGTSLASGILSILGVDMEGNRIPTPFNPKGSYEDYDFDAINKEILKAAGGDDLLNPPPRASILEEKERYGTLLKKFVVRKTKSHLWGWKTPSTILLIELH